MTSTPAAPALPPRGPDGRPVPADRAFRSTAVDALVEQVAGRIADPMLRRLFTGAFTVTLDTTIRARVLDGHPDT